MFNPFPIVQIINLFSVILLIFLNFHFWLKAKKSNLSSLKSFSLFFMVMMAMMIVFSLPHLVVQNPSNIQLLSNLGHLLYSLGLAYFLHLILLVSSIRNRFFVSLLPILLSILGVVIFVWQMMTLKPAQSATFDIGPFVFIDYQTTAPLYSNAIIGLLGILVFVTGLFLFLKNAVQTTESIVRFRSFLVAAGCFTAIIATFANFTLGLFPGLTHFLFIASIATFLSFFFVSQGILFRQK